MNTCIACKYKVWCITDQRVEYVWSENPPTVCPINAGHTIGQTVVTDDQTVVVKLDDTESPFNMKQNSVFCDTTSGNITLNLKKAKKTIMVKYMVKKTAASNTVTIDPHGSELIDGLPTKVLSSLNETVVVESNGTAWEVFDFYDVTTLDDFEKNITLIGGVNKGDIFIDDGNELDSLTVGSDGTVLTANSFTPSGVKWGQYDHTNLLSIGTNTHDQIDTHIANTEIHEIITASNKPGDEGVFSSKIDSDLEFKSLSQGTNITLVSNANTITINSTAGLNWQGDWISGNYIVDDAVGYTGNSYVCILNTVSNDPPSDATYWDILALQGDTGLQGDQGVQGIQGSKGMIWQGDWISRNYTVDDTVSYTGNSYICKLDTVSNEQPSNITYWDIVVLQGDTGLQGVQGDKGLNWQGDWISGNYIVDDAVGYTGNSYVCILNTVSNDPPSDATYWDLLALKGDDGATGGLTEQDFQSANSTTPTSTTSPSYIDLVSMTITASNSSSLDYLIIFCANGKHSTKGKIIDYIININSSDVTSTMRQMAVPNADESVAISVSHKATLSNGDVVKIRWKNGQASGTATTDERCLIIRGLG